VRGTQVVVRTETVLLTLLYYAIFLIFSKAKNNMGLTKPNKHQVSQPDPVKHKYISFAKSAIRIAAGIALVWPQNVILAGVFLIVAEVLGVAEEMV